MAESPPAAERPADPCVMVIFGGTGDLAKRKLIPALINLTRGGPAGENLLSPGFAIIGTGTTDLDTDSFRRRIAEEMEALAPGQMAPGQRDEVLERLHYLKGDLQDPGFYHALKDLIGQVDTEHGSGGNCLYYLAVAPRFFGEIIRRLGDAGLAREEGGWWRRVIIEKPFGRDLESARALNAEIRQVLEERQIYRIDHYLGKETVQNLLVFRFGNAVFEPIWNRRYIDHVAITAAETGGVEQRGGYYDTAGALRDMVPNHLFQLVSLTAMEPPASFDADAVRDEQAKVLRAIQPPSPEEVLTRAVRGQYGEGTSPDGPVPAYRSEARVAPGSNTESFVALKLSLDNWRWAEVPFYLRTGKRLARGVTEIAIQFRRVPFVLFRDTTMESLRTNRLVIRIQPREGISLRFGAKVPGTIMRQGAVEMNFNYADYFGCNPSTGYERLLHDAMLGDATLFQRADMVEAGWRVIDPILEVWSALPPRAFPNYVPESWGPKEADELMRRDGREWRKIEDEAPAPRRGCGDGT